MSVKLLLQNGVPLVGPAGVYGGYNTMLALGESPCPYVSRTMANPRGTAGRAQVSASGTEVRVTCTVSPGGVLGFGGGCDYKMIYAGGGGFTGTISTNVTLDDDTTLTASVGAEVNVGAGAAGWFPIVEFRYEDGGWVSGPALDLPAPWCRWNWAVHLSIRRYYAPFFTSGDWIKIDITQ